MSANFHSYQTLADKVRKYFAARDLWLKERTDKNAAIMRGYENAIKKIIEPSKEFNQWLAQ